MRAPTAVADSPLSRSFSSRSGSSRCAYERALAGGFGILIPQLDVVSGAGEADRPGAADEARTDDRHFAHSSLRSFEWPSQASQSLDVAVDADRLSGNVAPGRLQEIGDGCGDAARSHHAPQGHAVEIGPLHRLVGD